MRAAIFLAVLLALPAAAAAQVKSTATVASIYTAEALRDPFSPRGGGTVVKSTGTTEFSIHRLTLRGLMRDAGSEYALFGDEAGASYVLRHGLLYNQRGRAVGGISGKTNIKMKTASLMTSDRDVQVFRLGEEDKEQKE